MIQRFLWYLHHRNIHCHYFCLFCKYYDICKADVEYREEMGDRE